MSLSAVEVPIEKLLPEVLGKLETGKPSKQRRKGASNVTLYLCVVNISIRSLCKIEASTVRFQLWVHCMYTRVHYVSLLYIMIPIQSGVHALLPEYEQVRGQSWLIHARMAES